MSREKMIEAANLAKTFRLHNQGGIELPVFNGIELRVQGGECVVLFGPSGSGKSTLLRSIYGNYKPTAGSIKIRHEGKWIDIVTAPPQAILRVRKTTMGYVSQFLRVIPRVPTLDVVSEPLRAIGVEGEEAKDKARDLLTRLNVPEHLWHVAPATFSGGEQQRVNIARGFIFDYPILLLDEPTASLDEENQEAVLGLIFEARDRGAALVGIFHDPGVRKAIGSRHFEMPYSEVA